MLHTLKSTVVCSIKSGIEWADKKLLTGGGREVEGGRTEGSSAVGDGG